MCQGGKICPEQQKAMDRMQDAIKKQDFLIWGRVLEWMTNHKKWSEEMSDRFTAEAARFEIGEHKT